MTPTRPWRADGFAGSSQWSRWRNMASTVADIALAAILAAAPSTVDGAEAKLAAAGTEFVLTLPDGRTLRSQDLVGAVLRIGAPGREIGVTIASIEEDLRAI